MIGRGLIMPKQLPDTPWHIGSPKMKESDHRRLNKWCIHYDSSFCTEPKSGCYMLRCAGSSHCKFYAEDVKTSKKIEKDSRTQVEIDTENRRQYVDTLKPKMRALISSSDCRRYTSVQFLRTCYICGSKLLEIGNQRKQCPLCHMEYVDQSCALSDDKIAAEHFVYIMGQDKPQKPKSSSNSEPCPFCDELGKCREQGAPLYKKKCKPKYCKKLKKQIVHIKQLKENEFIGVKNISINRIVIQNMAPPKQSKLDSAIEAIQQSGKVTKPIYVELYKDKYLLKDGYIRYLAALHCGLSSIPATLEAETEEKK